jgi:hypothetical protein
MKHPIPDNLCYEGIFCAIEIRRSIGVDTTWRITPPEHAWTYRVRRGNGFYNTKIGTKYQDKYKWFVPKSINNPESQFARDAFKTAVSNWKNVLTEQEKNEWNKIGKRKNNMGRNLYISDYMKKNAPSRKG